jgi:malate dehydrogenase
MFSRSAIRTLAAPSSRLFSSSSARHTKVAVLGAGGGIGQPLSLLLKSDPLVTSLSLYDIRGAPGVAADVSHVDTASEVIISFHSVKSRMTCNRSKDMPLTVWTLRWRV